MHIKSQLISRTKLALITSLGSAVQFQCVFVSGGELCLNMLVPCQSKACVAPKFFPKSGKKLHYSHPTSSQTVPRTKSKATFLDVQWRPHSAFSARNGRDAQPLRRTLPHEETWPVLDVRSSHGRVALVDTCNVNKKRKTIIHCRPFGRCLVCVCGCVITKIITNFKSIFPVFSVPLLSGNMVAWCTEAVGKQLKINEKEGKINT
jgi:hypothetical protein